MIIFGDKTVALLDLWSLEHFFTGCNTALFCSIISDKYFCREKKTKFTFQLMLLLILELYWEIFEHYLEAGVSYDVVTNWFAGVEHIANRSISDPIVTVLGLLFIRKFPNFRIFSVIFSLVWLYVNIFMMPNSMSLNDMIVNFFHNF